MSQIGLPYGMIMISMGFKRSYLQKGIKQHALNLHRAAGLINISEWFIIKIC